MINKIFHSHHLTHPKYRPDIDGLRAIAILSVVGFHAFPNRVSGGFIGVDIFFVISGYLISYIVFDSLAHNRFSFIEFYIRRVRRIFPALILVLVACFIFGWFALLPSEYKQLGKHIAGGAGFISNYILWGESGYFDNASETKPLLHLWSLGVEEQFYIVWPLLLWFVWKRRLNMVTTVVLVGLISFALNVGRINGGHIEAAFYSPQTRFWELLTGAILAYSVLHNWRAFPRVVGWLDRLAGRVIYAAPPEEGQALRNLQSFIGAGLIAVGVYLVTGETHFPGWWALLPTLGAALMIAAGMRAWLNRAVLSNRILMWVGLISFPLYLWHWPLLSFARIVGSGEPTALVRVGLVLLAFLLAWLTYFLVEKPLRFGKHARLKALVLMLVMAVIGGVGYNTFVRDGLEFRGNIKAIEVKAALHKLPTYSEEGCSGQYHFAYDEYCRMTRSQMLPDSVLIGDSHSIALFPGLNMVFEKLGHNLVLFGRGGCVPFFNVESNGGGVDTSCRMLMNQLLDFAISDNHIKTIILTNRSMLYIDGSGPGSMPPRNRFIGLSTKPGITDHREIYGLAMDETLAKLVSSHKQIYFIEDVPELDFDAKTCLPTRPFASGNNATCRISKAFFIKRTAVYHEVVDKLLKKYPTVKVITPSKYMCDENWCYGKSEADDIFYVDGDHLTLAGSMFLGEHFLKDGAFADLDSAK